MLVHTTRTTVLTVLEHPLEEPCRLHPAQSQKCGSSCELRVESASKMPTQSPVTGSARVNFTVIESPALYDDLVVATVFETRRVDGTVGTGGDGA